MISRTLKSYVLFHDFTDDEMHPSTGSNKSVYYSCKVFFVGLRCSHISMPVAATFLFVTESRKPNKSHWCFLRFRLCATQSGFDITFCPACKLENLPSIRSKELGDPCLQPHVQSRSKVLFCTTLFSSSRTLPFRVMTLWFDSWKIIGDGVALSSFLPAKSFFSTSHPPPVTKDLAASVQLESS